MRFGQGSAPRACDQRAFAFRALLGIGGAVIYAGVGVRADAIRASCAAVQAASRSLKPRLRPGPSDKNLTAQVPKSLPIPMPSLAPLVQHVSSAVVTISAQGSRRQNRPHQDDTEDENGDRPGGLPFEDFLRRFFDKRGMPETGREFVGLGSGFIVDPQGYIVTNNHVVSKAEKITVILQDNSRHEAKVVGRDEKTDLALIKIDTKEKLPFVTWGDSDQAKVGDWVVAVGNPFGLGGTVTAGIISAVGRNINEGPYDDYIQIDAPINRGNSGGPTFNLGAEVIGVNTAIYSPSGGSVGIGFAVPSNIAKNVIQQLKESGHVTRGWLGRRDPGDHAGHRQEPRAQSRTAERRAGRLGDAEQPGGQGRGQAGRRHHLGRRPSGQAGRRSAADRSGDAAGNAARSDDPARRQGDEARRHAWRIVGKPEAGGRRDTQTRTGQALSGCSSRR